MSPGWEYESSARRQGGGHPPPQSPAVPRAGDPPDSECGIAVAKDVVAEDTALRTQPCSVDDAALGLSLSTPSATFRGPCTAQPLQTNSTCRKRRKRQVRRDSSVR